MLELPVGERRLEEALRDREPGIVHDEVDTTESEHGAGDGLSHVVLGPHVGPHVHREVGTADLRCDRPGGGGVEVGDDHACALAREASRRLVEAVVEFSIGLDQVEHTMGEGDAERIP